MKYKLFISDYDGTLGSTPDVISEENVKAIKEYQKKGGKFVICTGRSYPSIKVVCDKYGINGLIVAFQGALAIDGDTGETLFNSGMEKQDAVDILTDLLNEGVETGVYIDNLFHYQQKGFGISEYERLVGFKGVQVEDIIQFVKDTPLPIRKVLSVAEPQVKDEIMARLQPKYKDRLILNASSQYFLEVINPIWSKGNAVKRIAEYYNIPLNEVIAVGDSLNDLELINGNWHGVIVGDGMEEVKKYADEITLPFKDNPIEYLLKKYCL